MRKFFVLTTVLMLALLLTIACSEERGQAILTISNVVPANDPFGDILTDEGSIPSDSVDITFRNDLKNPEGLKSTTYADIIIESITISFIRTDGGSDMPDTFRVGVSFRVPSFGSYNASGFVIVPATLKTKFPLSDLLFYGYERSTYFNSIKYDIRIEAEGHTLEGDRVYASGKIPIEFANWAD